MVGDRVEIFYVTADNQALLKDLIPILLSEAETFSILSPEYTKSYPFPSYPNLPTIFQIIHHHNARPHANQRLYCSCVILQYTTHLARQWKNSKHQFPCLELNLSNASPCSLAFGIMLYFIESKDIVKGRKKGRICSVERRNGFLL